MVKKRSRRGETLVETLAAILIVVLTSTFFLTATIATAKINRSARTADDSLRVAQQQVERRQNGQKGQVEIRLKSGQTVKYDVTFYGDSDKLQSYTGG